LAYAVIAPLLMSALAMIVPIFSQAPGDRFAVRWGPVALALGPLAYFVFRRKS